MRLTPIESSVMQMLLSGDNATLAVLRAQMDVAVVRKREFTGVGFYTSFEIPLDVPRLAASKSVQISDVAAQMAGLEYGAGFILFVNNGAIDTLEGYTYDEPWPTEIERLQLSYVGGSQRDWKALQLQIAQ